MAREETIKVIGFTLGIFLIVVLEFKDIIIKEK